MPKLVNLGHFLPFYLPKNPQKSKLWKMKKFAGYIIILHKCTKNYNHMVYSSWDTEWDRQNFLSFWAIFCPFTTPNNPKKSKFWKKNQKMPGYIILLYIHVYNKWRSYDIWLLKYNMWQTNFCHFRPYFALSAPWQPKKSKFQNQKKHLEILSFYTFAP